MSLPEMIESVKSLSVEEQQQLHDVLEVELTKAIGISPDWFKPGAVAYITPPMTVDEAVLQEMYSRAGLKGSE